jgi:hypothetical protein
MLNKVAVTVFVAVVLIAIAAENSVYSGSNDFLIFKDFDCTSYSFWKN